VIYAQTYGVEEPVDDLTRDAGRIAQKRPRVRAGTRCAGAE